MNSTKYMSLHGTLDRAGDERRGGAGLLFEANTGLLGLSGLFASLNQIVVFHFSFIACSCAMTGNGLNCILLSDAPLYHIFFSQFSFLFRSYLSSSMTSHFRNLVLNHEICDLPLSSVPEII